MLFYMAVRLRGQTTAEIDLELNEKVNNKIKDPYMGNYLSYIQMEMNQDPVG